MLLQSLEGVWQVGERRAIAQGAWLTLNHRQIMPPVINCPSLPVMGSIDDPLTRDGTRAYRFGRAIAAGRVWTNCYHAYPAHAAFGGYKQSGIGRETHKMMLNHYQQTKNLLVSFDPKPLGFF